MPLVPLEEIKDTKMVFLASTDDQLCEFGNVEDAVLKMNTKRNEADFVTLINIPEANQDTFLRNSKTEILHSILNVLPSMWIGEREREKNPIIFPEKNADSFAASLKM